MSHDEMRTRMADYLDGLLEEDEARSVETEIGRAPALLAEVARMRAVLYRPYPVTPPSAGQEERILARHHRRPLWRVVRYAAVFLAGVLTTLLVVAGDAGPPPSIHGGADETSHDPSPPVVTVEAPRRIR